MINGFTLILLKKWSINTSRLPIPFPCHWCAVEMGAAGNGWQPWCLHLRCSRHFSWPYWLRSWTPARIQNHRFQQLARAIARMHGSYHNKTNGRPPHGDREYSNPLLRILKF
ncbi:conserved hypothetical protein [Culex quinquefasciatus]|uniref:Uncharacterized protein n=1 Tax=Culex quinquefasciatus TaxID=7176 RepID=B0WLT3_CULQU|nr:conserved hypothetical protein [Culex quinquefasciatus]|eukprot:XP_001849667.1 conserved hypothetical protein [Culex quinquefasciatus]